MDFMEVARAQGLPVKRLYTVAECAQVLGTSQSTLRREAKAGRLRCKRAGSSLVLIAPEWADEWAEAGR